MVRNGGLPEPAPRNQPERQSIALVALSESFDHWTRHQAEAAGAAGRVSRDCKASDQPVEQGHSPGTQGAVIATGPGAPHDVVAFTPTGHEVANQRGRILQVRRHHDSGVTMAVVDPRGNRDVAPEIAWKPHGVHAIVLLAQPGKHIERPVATAIVDENEFPFVVPYRPHHVGHSLVKRAQVALLVEHGHDDGEKRFGHAQVVTA